MTRVGVIRDSMISARFLALYRQLTLRPARLMTASAPASRSVQSPGVCPSHGIARHGDFRGFRLRTITSWPSAWKARARTVPTCPDPPGMTIFIASSFRIPQTLQSFVGNPNPHEGKHLLDKHRRIQLDTTLLPPSRSARNVIPTRKSH